MAEKEKLSLEAGFEQLENIINKLENEDIPLERSFALYSEGMELLKYCNASLDTVEKKVMKLSEEGGLVEF